MAKRRGNDEGTIYFHEPSQRWTGQLTVGRDPVSGKVRRVTVYGSSQREVREKLEEERRKPRDAPSAQPVSVAIDFWLNAHKTRVDPATALRYEQELAPVKQYLGKLSLGRLSAFDVADLFRWMAQEGFSASQQKRAGSRLRQCLKRCMTLDLIHKNPAAQVALPRTAAAEVRPMTAEQARALLDAAKGRHEALFWLALDTGARQGELWALTAEDIDLAVPEVFFNKSLQDYKGALRVKTTKTPKGRRRVPLTRATADRLRAALPYASARSGLLFCDSRGGFLRRANFQKNVWLPLLKGSGLEGFRFHDLRHTCATLLLLANVHPKVVSERLGHSKIEITLNTYCHLLPTMQERAVIALEQALLPTAVKVQ